MNFSLENMPSEIIILILDFDFVSNDILSILLTSKLISSCECNVLKPRLGSTLSKLKQSLSKREEIRQVARVRTATVGFETTILSQLRVASEYSLHLIREFNHYMALSLCMEMHIDVEIIDEMIKIGQNDQLIKFLRVKNVDLLNYRIKIRLICIGMKSVLSLM